jgi:transcription antitermination factor NusG
MGVTSKWAAEVTGTGQAPQWFALHTRSNFEALVAGELGEKGMEAYLPAFDEMHRWKDRTKRISVPVFPGYVFARFQNLPAVRLEVVKARGVVRILGSGADIEAVPDNEIEAVQRILNAKLPCFGHPFLREGDWVIVKRGVLRGLEGILLRVKNRTRLVVSVSLLSQSVATELDASDVEPLWRGKAGK